MVTYRGLEKYASAYIDDVAIYSETWEDHLKQLKSVLERLRAANLTAKPKKCRFGMDGTCHWWSACET